MYGHGTKCQTYSSQCNTAARSWHWWTMKTFSCFEALHVRPVSYGFVKTMHSAKGMFVGHANSISCATQWPPLNTRTILIFFILSAHTHTHTHPHTHTHTHTHTHIYIYIYSLTYFGSTTENAPAVMTYTGRFFPAWPISANSNARPDTLPA